jgi:hypothetical protein
MFTKAILTQQWTNDNSWMKGPTHGLNLPVEPKKEAPLLSFQHTKTWYHKRKREE